MVQREMGRDSGQAEWQVDQVTTLGPCVINEMGKDWYILFRARGAREKPD